jgi:hypothetical protein
MLWNIERERKSIHVVWKFEYKIVLENYLDIKRNENNNNRLLLW